MLNREIIIKDIIDNKDWKSMCGLMKSPTPGKYYVTGMQMGNLHGEMGWIRYVGYCVQIRKGCGEFRTDIILLRRPDGSIGSYTNCDMYEVKGQLLEKLKSIFDEGVTPELMEDYTQPYTIPGGYPEIGAVVEPKECQIADGGPRMRITTTQADGSKSVTEV